MERPDNKNFISWYIFAQGESEVPALYDIWCGISLIAAAVANRVWVEHFVGSKLYPNLFILLLGPSGIGKDVAMDRAAEVIEMRDDHDERIMQDINFFSGKATVQYLLDKMGSRSRKELDGSVALYLHTPELTSSIGAGNQAADFIHVITDLYKSRVSDFEEGTRGRGGQTLNKPVVNWVGGTTREWLVSSVPADALEGGFIGRVVLAEAMDDFTRRIRRPIQPRDRLDILRGLAKYLDQLSTVTGKMELSDQAEDIAEDWYTRRPPPEDSTMAAAWRRQYALSLKISTCLALADSASQVIEGKHMARAQRLIQQSYNCIPRLKAFVSSTAETRAALIAEDRIKQGGAAGVTRSSLTKYMSNRGVTATKLDRDILPTLLEQGRVVTVRGEKGAKVYVWRPRSINMEEVFDDGTE